LIDIVFGLNKIGYFEDKKLWTAVLDRLKNKTHTWEYQEVTNHGWSLDVYEHF
jgi:hypothetical protein